jgi:hypothetical protein
MAADDADPFGQLPGVAQSALLLFARSENSFTCFAGKVAINGELGLQL